MFTNGNNCFRLLSALFSVTGKDQRGALGTTSELTPVPGIASTGVKAAASGKQENSEDEDVASRDAAVRRPPASLHAPQAVVEFEGARQRGNRPGKVAKKARKRDGDDDADEAVPLQAEDLQDVLQAGVDPLPQHAKQRQSRAYDDTRNATVHFGELNTLMISYL